jgi:hypothetical protein
LGHDQTLGSAVSSPLIKKEENKQQSTHIIREKNLTKDKLDYQTLNITKCVNSGQYSSGVRRSVNEIQAKKTCLSDVSI